MVRRLFKKNLKAKSKRAAARGFTLIELMAASTGALFITVGVYAFTRNVTDYFQRQMRLSGTTMNAVTGFERMRNDIQRAGFLSSPNLAKDPMRCPRPAAAGPAQPPEQIAPQFVAYTGLQRMALARLVQGQTIAEYPGNYMLTENAGGLDPDQLILYGNYSSTEEFPAKGAPPGTNTITLTRDSVAMRRLGIPAVNAAAEEAILQAVFKPGRILRVMDTSGRHQYAIVGVTPPNFSADSTGDATVFLEPGLQLIRKESADGGTCGIRGGGTQLTVNPIDIVRYRLVNLNDAAAYPEYVPFFNTADLALPAYDDTRLDLVREELNPIDESVFEGSTELIAEYAADLKFGITANNDVVTGVNTYFGEDHGNLMDYADIPFSTNSGQAGAFGPHLIRGIHARLAVRTREASYKAPLLTGTALASATSADLYRIEVADKEFAVLRSLRAHIATRNSGSESW